MGGEKENDAIAYYLCVCVSIVGLCCVCQSFIGVVYISHRRVCVLLVCVHVSHRLVLCVPVDGCFDDSEGAGDVSTMTATLVVVASFFPIIITSDPTATCKTIESYDVHGVWCVGCAIVRVRC